MADSPFTFDGPDMPVFYKHGKYEVAIDSVSGSKNEIHIQWLWRGGGFGVLTFRMRAGGALVRDDECMSDEFVEAVLLALAKVTNEARNEKAR